MISAQFAISVGSVPGFTHQRTYRNNQDGVWVVEAPHGLAAFVCDGCSAGTHTEVGAQLMARFLAHRSLTLLERNALTAQWDLADPHDRQAFRVTLQRQALEFLHSTLAWIGGNRLQCIQDLFLFTVIGTVITPDIAMVLSQGDGVFETNGHYQVIDEGNQPHYLAYALVDRQHLSVDPGPITLVERVAVRTDALTTLKLGSDGAAVLEARRHEWLRDGSPQGGLAQFEHTRYASNPSALQKRLIVIGALNRRAADDLTLVVIQRRTPS